MSVRKRKWRDKQGRQHEKWMVHIEHTWPDGRKQTIRKVSPVQTKRGAEQYERELRSQLVSGQWKGAKQQTPTLEGFTEEFLAYQATVNKPTELSKKRGIILHHLIPAFGKRPLDQIDARAIDAYKAKKLEQLSRRGKPFDPKTVNHHIKVLGRMLRVAHKWNLLHEVPQIGKLKERKSDFDFLDFEETEAFIAAAAEHSPEWHPFVVVAIRTGLRVGELVALRWREDVDLNRGRVRVQRSYHPKNGFRTTKNDKIRELPLTWDAVEALEVQRSRVDGELVFPGPNGGVTYANPCNDALEEIATAIDMRPIHNHGLRHTFASHAVMRGIPISQVQQWLGHGSILMTMRYAHLARGFGDDLIGRLAPDRPHGANPRRGGAKSQHMGSTWKRPGPKSVSKPPLGDGS
ncbi:Tyrosine recombinase XerD [Enhygromyxa salina]|uniref:Tyrosine recombinase XerD n=1 Tax=Enhygromyxa salina TaxID=215803 RepID=A0A2S9XXR1_9BACT|nr:site-specific integrase [Enhygromyxa salina]PRP97659.1 Tyrosine recombinase XerD [Enhygromyxa salina]